MAVDIKDVEQVAQELQQKFDDFKAKNDKRVDAIEQEKGKLARAGGNRTGNSASWKISKATLKKSCLS